MYSATLSRQLLGRVVIFATLLAAIALPATAATIVNIDIDPRDPPDPVHTGDDGVLSSVGGTFWNHVGLDFLADVDVNNLKNEFGAPTIIDVTFDAAGSVDANFRAIELYAGGGIGTLDIKSLDVSLAYDLAIYAHDANLSVTVTDASGTDTKSTGSTFDIELPGDEGEEYVLFQNLVPADLGGGVFGLTVDTNGAIRMAGMQLRFAPEPSGMVLLTVAAALLSFAGRRKTARRKSPGLF